MIDPDIEISVRRCTTGDVATLVSLGIRTFRETFEAVNTPENMKLYLEKNFYDEKLEEEMRESGSIFFLAEYDHKAVGFAKVRTVEIPVELAGYRPMEIERIYAVREVIGKGVGKRLMETCLDHARSGGFDLVWLGVWEHNEPAKAFYEKWGFEKFGAHVFMLGTDAQTDLLMKKVLN